LVVTTRKPDASEAAGETVDKIEKMGQETDELLAQSARLIAQVDELLETGRQLRAAQAALLEQRRKNKRIK
jgi:pyrimidine operon attenuation protein/uracil phosphoribosyltransferase